MAYLFSARETQKVPVLTYWEFMYKWSSFVPYDTKQAGGGMADSGGSQLSTLKFVV